MTRLLTATTLAALVLVSACDRREASRPPAEGDASGAVTPAGAAAPLVYESATPFAEVKLTLPEAVKAQPDLHARLYAEGVRDLKAFNEGAQADRTEFGGDEQMQPYARELTWRPAGETGRLLSLSQTGSEYTGGAHPIPVLNATIWDKAMKRPIAPAALFRPGADMAVLDRALCAAANAAKKQRDPQAQTVGLTGEGFTCPKAITVPFVLAPAPGGKAGGLTFLIGPYLVGPYAEGSYEATVPAEAFRALLAPEYAGEFAGA